MKKQLIIVAIIASLVGCSANGPKESGGTLIGGATGALVGAQFGKGTGQLVGVALGALLGSQLGAAAGKAMDEKDRKLASHTASIALENEPDNRPIVWKNPNNDHSGSFVATRTTQVSADKVCRDYVQTVIIDGEQTKVYGRACRDIRDPQGQWMVQK